MSIHWRPAAGSLIPIALIAAAMLCPVAAHAGVVWDEAVDGDLTGNWLAPDDLDVTAGSNIVFGTTGNYDREYFTFSLGPDQTLSAIIVRNYISTDDYSFIAVQEGTIFTENPDSPEVGNLLGWALFGTYDVGQDILSEMGQGPGSIGFVPPLTGPDYAFWLQQTGDLTDYELEFLVVPEPSTLIVGIGFLACLGAGARKSYLRKHRLQCKFGQPG